MTDKYYVYRPLLDLIGKAEGTDRGRGYDETLAYGKLTGGPVNLTSMTLTEIDGLQTKMLQHPDNKWKSSAVGRYQIIRTTLRSIRKTLGLEGTAVYSKDMQDRLACFLLGQRGIDKYLAGRMSEGTMVNNLAQEWASFPKMNGRGHYDGQNALVSLAEVRAALAEVRARHKQGQPKEVPTQVEDVVAKETKRLGWGTSIFGAVGAGIAWLREHSIYDMLLFVGITIVGLIILAYLGPRLAKSLRQIKEELG